MSAAARPTTPRPAIPTPGATASVGNNHYADVNGNVYKNTGERLAAALVERLVRVIGRHVVGRQGVAGAQLPAATGWAGSARRAQCNATAAAMADSGAVIASVEVVDSVDSAAVIGSAAADSAVGAVGVAGSAVAADSAAAVSADAADRTASTRQISTAGVLR